MALAATGPSLLSRKFWPPPPHPPTVSLGRQSQPPSISPGRFISAPPPPWQLRWRQRSPPQPSQYHRRHLRTSNPRESKAILNVKTKSEVLTFFPDYSLK